MRIIEEMAQEIAERIMKEIPYNVNIMNEKGIIIGSGDSHRLGELHNGAVMAIKQKQMITLYEKTKEGKPGVNLPINFQNKIIGVVGLSGNPKIVTPLASIVKATVELLINQNYLNAENRTKERMKGNFLFQWSMRDIPYNQNFISQGRGVGIDILVPRFALVINGYKVKELSILQDGEYALPFNDNTYIYLLKSKKNLETIQSKVLGNPDVYIAVGKIEPIISNSIQQALRIIRIAKNMKWGHSIIHYEQHEMVDRLLQSNLDVSDIVHKFEELEGTDRGTDYIETLKNYIEHDGNIKEIAQLMHIHRNSLNYRLDKIKAEFGLDPRKSENLFVLYLGLIFYLGRD